jgi:3-phenylpropionate/trans-cinnamate dioxygenase ferredoxin subunit
VSGAYHRILAVADVPAGTKKTVQVGTHCILVCNPGEQIFAVTNVCSHALKPLEKGRMTGNSISCPTHGARFDLATGKPLNPPAFKPIATYAVRVVDEWIEVLVEAPG